VSGGKKHNQNGSDSIEDRWFQALPPGWTR
jgi:hypothetical protein